MIPKVSSSRCGAGRLEATNAPFPGDVTQSELLHHLPGRGNLDTDMYREKTRWRHRGTMVVYKPKTGAWNRSFPTHLGRNQPCQHHDLRLLASELAVPSAWQRSSEQGDGPARRSESWTFPLPRPHHMDRQILYQLSYKGSPEDLR